MQKRRRKKINKSTGRKMSRMNIGNRISSMRENSMYDYCFLSECFVSVVITLRDKHMKKEKQTNQ